MYYIYKITNTINNKCYIGKTIDPKKRFKYHKTSNDYVIHKAIHKYGVENFKFEVIDKTEYNEQINELEKYYIKYFNTLTPNGYNVAKGGDGGYTLPNNKHSKEVLKYLSEINKGGRNPNAKPRKYYETKTMCRSNFKKVCQRRDWNFEDFEEINSGLKVRREKLYYYKYKY